MFEKIKRAVSVLLGRDKSVSLSDHTNLLKFLGIDANTDADALSEATYFACMKVLCESLVK